ncbi:hypothetical protein GCM10007385_35870 [Tateyamaria omphalii]|uniref:hypothetical protein n=1 Tax=Tateyamaria omphalii TaxID=299262 RepID=UPI00167A7A48|nr:hypothetical protein [Tateyamaria omphalii]GGX63543.1 hypothetical protein GCM10007385_35870 [Tateyamaria omphalii]
MRSLFVHAALVSMIAMLGLTSPVLGQSLNFKQSPLTCTFTHHCYPGRQLKMQSNGVVDYSNCVPISARVTWNPQTQLLTFDGVARKSSSARLKRRTATVQAVFDRDIYTLAASAKVSSVRVTAISQPNGPVTDYYNGQCEAAK